MASPLPVIRGSVTGDDLVRLYCRTELHWCRHLGDETQLETGTAISNPVLAAIWEANQVLDADLPERMTPAAALAVAEQFFGALGLKCWQWAMNPSIPAERAIAMSSYLISQGWKPDVSDICCLTAARGAVPEVPGLTVIPARASFRHARELARLAAAERWGEAVADQLADAAALHLDDPHWDLLIALADGKAVASAGVLAAGDIGRIDSVFVVEPMRMRGIGRAMMGHVLEICLRSRFRYVMLDVDPRDGAARRLYEVLGFNPIGRLVMYQRPATDPIS